MAKNPTRWDNENGSSIATPVDGALLLENGNYLLLEDGSGHLLLEPSGLATKEQTDWNEL